MALTQAEWIDGALHLRLSPLDDDPNAWTSFRILGAEAASWEAHGPDGTTVEIGAAGTTVRSRLVHADLTITPS